MGSVAVAPQRPHSANVYKPAGLRPIQTGIPWVDGGSTSISSKVDLSLPIRGMRMKVSGRVSIGTLAFTAGYPEGLLNLISEIVIAGNNSRQNGQVTLWDIDLATLWGIQHLFQHRAGLFTIGGVSVPIPGTPWPAPGASGYFNPAIGNYDFTIVVDIPLHPFKAGPGIRPGFLVREEEYADSLTVKFGFGSSGGGGGATGCLGVSAATSTIAFSGYGGGGTSPTIDLYSLPVQMGSLKDTVTPGVITRVAQAVPLTSAGQGVSIAQLQKQRTGRIYLKSGTAVGAGVPAFATLNDTNVTALGLTSGGSNRNIKPLVDVQGYKADQPASYEREAIQGYTCMDFLESGNPDSAFPAQNSKVVGTGSTFNLVANVAGIADGYALVVQEQITHLHAGKLYQF